MPCKAHNAQQDTELQSLKPGDAGGQNALLHRAGENIGNDPAPHEGDQDGNEYRQDRDQRERSQTT